MLTRRSVRAAFLAVLLSCCAGFPDIQQLDGLEVGLYSVDGNRGALDFLCADIEEMDTFTAEYPASPSFFQNGQCVWQVKVKDNEDIVLINRWASGYALCHSYLDWEFKDECRWQLNELTPAIDSPYRHLPHFSMQNAGSANYLSIDWSRSTTSIFTHELLFYVPGFFDAFEEVAILENKTTQPAKLTVSLGVGVVDSAKANDNGGNQDNTDRAHALLEGLQIGAGGGSGIGWGSNIHHAKLWKKNSAEVMSTKKTVKVGVTVPPNRKRVVRQLVGKFNGWTVYTGDYEVAAL